MRLEVIMRNRVVPFDILILLWFKNMIDNCGLMEFPSLGNTLSWSGRR